MPTVDSDFIADGIPRPGFFPPSTGVDAFTKGVAQFEVGVRSNGTNVGVAGVSYQSQNSQSSGGFFQGNNNGVQAMVNHVANPPAIPKAAVFAWGAGGGHTTAVSAESDGDGVPAVEVRNNDLRGVGVQATADNGVAVRATANGGTALQVRAGLIEIRGVSIGTATIGAGTNSVIVNGVGTPDSMILLTPLANPGGALYISNQGPAFFVITTAGGPANFDIPVQYLVIN